jgi:hypothetical protein
LNPWLITGAVVAAVGLFLAGDYHGKGVKDTEWRARTQAAVNEAVKQTRITEREQQEAATDAIQRQYWEQVAIADDLAADLERMRNRPSRPTGVPAPASPDCAGATGRELSAEDAGFLVRLAADADRHRAALAACYAYADAVMQPWKNQNSKN